ncbi:beta-ketoacyl synthase N-terminal-like domain-containing protein [Virgibacillus sp.]|uniref:beta-ketoacyl synthase N-terminal-like domain-containing protein n=1 Tax=Virgibacillus sp. TaxID=1872700 RepID=UPI0017E7D33A|nr:beta-ketoacyl synthase N-terminal-like domain-containing protein [Virgibacillus sp.]NWO15086.1 hypothetical protein [Virgibacillus sp.]
MKEVSISGFNVVTPFGSGFDSLPGESISDFIISNCFEIDDNLESNLPLIKRFPREIKIPCISMYEAVKNVGINTRGEKKYTDIGIIVGTSFSNLKAIYDFYLDAEKYGIDKINPRLFPNTVLNSISGYASMLLGAVGANITISQGGESGVKLLEYAEDLLNRNILRKAIVCEVNLNVPTIFQHRIDYQLKPESISSLVLQIKDKGLPLNDFKIEHYDFRGKQSYAVLDIMYRLKLAERKVVG